MQLTLDTFRALARSSPWRWRTLHFTRRGDLGAAEAWLRRPGELLVRLGDGSEEYVTGAPYGTTLLMARSSSDVPVRVAEPEEPEPTFRTDGLVARRPDDYHLRHGDPMWHNYTWTAMLDPEELSHDVMLDDLRVDELGGREAWRATARPDEGYEPRCGCCPLLWSEIAALAEYGDEPERLAQFAARGYPEAHEVALDVQTGVVLALEPVDGTREDLAFTVVIHEVDADLDAVFADRPAAP